MARQQGAYQANLFSKDAETWRESASQRLAAGARIGSPRVQRTSAVVQEACEWPRSGLEYLRELVVPLKLAYFRLPR